MKVELQQAIQQDLDALWSVYVNGNPHGPDESETVHGMDFLATLVDYAHRVIFNSRGATADMETLRHLLQAALNCAHTRESILVLVPPVAEPAAVSEPSNGGDQ